VALDDAAWRQVVDGLRERFTVLHFTFGPPPVKPMEGVVAMSAMSLRQTAALFFAIGKFVGVDGGEMQLMLAAGGRAIALSPPASATYDPARWQYASERDWGTNPVRSKYLAANDWAHLGEHLSFLENPAAAAA